MSDSDLPPEGVVDEEGCGGWYATHNEETGKLERVWDKGYLTFKEARACYQHEHTEHGKRAVLFAERIGSDRLCLRRGYATVCCNCVDEVKKWPTFGGLKYEFGEEGSFGGKEGSLSISRDRAMSVISHATMTAIIDAADYARWGYAEEHIRVHGDHAEMACSALSEFHEHDLKAAVALAAMQQSLLQLWRPKEAEREPT